MATSEPVSPEPAAGLGCVESESESENESEPGPGDFSLEEQAELINSLMMPLRAMPEHDREQEPEPATVSVSDSDFDDSHLLPSSPPHQTDWKDVLNDDYSTTFEFVTNSSGDVLTGYRFLDGKLNGITRTGLHTYQRMAGATDSAEPEADGMLVHMIEELGEFLLRSDYHLIMRQTSSAVGTDASVGEIQVRLVGTDYALQDDEFRCSATYHIITANQHRSNHWVLTDTSFDAKASMAGAWSCLPHIISVWCCHVPQCACILFVVQLCGGVVMRC